MGEGGGGGREGGAGLGGKFWILRPRLEILRTDELRVDCVNETKLKNQWIVIYIFFGVMPEKVLKTFRLWAVDFFSVNTVRDKDHFLTPERYGDNHPCPLYMYMGSPPGLHSLSSPIYSDVLNKKHVSTDTFLISIGLFSLATSKCPPVWKKNHW